MCGIDVYCNKACLLFAYKHGHKEMCVVLKDRRASVQGTEVKAADACVICHGALTERSKLPCGHNAFHPECIVGMKDKTCPLCRHPFPCVIELMTSILPVQTALVLQACGVSLDGYKRDLIIAADHGNNRAIQMLIKVFQDSDPDLCTKWMIELFDRNPSSTCVRPLLKKLLSSNERLLFEEVLNKYTEVAKSTRVFMLKKKLLRKKDLAVYKEDLFLLVNILIVYAKWMHEDPSADAEFMVERFFGYVKSVEECADTRLLLADLQFNDGIYDDGMRLLGMALQDYEQSVAAIPNGILYCVSPLGHIIDWTKIVAKIIDLSDRLHKFESADRWAAKLLARDSLNEYALAHIKKAALRSILV